jgi:hypothetical protein
LYLFLISPMRATCPIHLIFGQRSLQNGISFVLLTLFHLYCKVSLFVLVPLRNTFFSNIRLLSVFSNKIEVCSSCMDVYECTHTYRYTDSRETEYCISSYPILKLGRQFLCKALRVEGF